MFQLAVLVALMISSLQRITMTALGIYHNRQEREFHSTHSPVVSSFLNFRPVAIFTPILT